MPATVAGLKPSTFALLAEFATTVLMILGVNNNHFLSFSISLCLQRWLDSNPKPLHDWGIFLLCAKDAGCKKQFLFVIFFLLMPETETGLKPSTLALLKEFSTAVLMILAENNNSFL